MLKGVYDASTTYTAGDVVKYADGAVYRMHRTAPSGTPPTNSLYWTRQTGVTAVAVLIALDALALVEAKYDDQIDAIGDQIDALDERVTALEPAPETEENTESDAT
jgi:hypothetical protein